MACSTCHVYVADAWAGKVGEPCDAELDMLDLAFDPQPTSRLGCQLTLSRDLDGLRLAIPDDAHNLMDDIPFDDAR
jgi:2Fe-2S ferredoxin